jgi:hypothetical protein
MYFEGKCFLLFRDIMRPSEAMLVNDQGHIYSGSNTFDSGKLCLGSALDPLTMNPVDALCFNAANADLVWQGASLEGAWEHNPDPTNPRLARTASNRIFKVTTWPTWTPSARSLHPPTQPIPLQILDATRDW